MIFRGKSALSSAYVESYILARGKEVAYLMARYNASPRELNAHFRSLEGGGEGIYSYTPTKKQEKKEQQKVSETYMVDKVEMEVLDDWGEAVDMTISYVPYDPDRYARERADRTSIEKLIEYAKCDPVAKKMIRQYKDVVADMLRPRDQFRPRKY